MTLNSEGEIQITTVSWYSTALIRDLVQNLCDKAESPELLRFLVIDNSNGKDDKLPSVISEDVNIEIRSFSGEGLQGSVAHASALNIGMKYLDAPYVLITDPDIHVFQSGWDEICRNELSKGFGALGAPYPPWKLGKIHDFPSPIFFFTETKSLLNLQPDWYPFPGTLRRSYNFFARKVLRLGPVCSKERLRKHARLRSLGQKLERKIGICSPDTGWKIVESMRGRSYLPKVFEAVYADDGRLKMNEGHSSLLDLAKHFELYLFNDKPFMTHFYGSGTFHWTTGKSGQTDFWKENIIEYEESAPKVF
jgi:hypothetical protein